jgi:hypothetical protein
MTADSSTGWQAVFREPPHWRPYPQPGQEAPLSVLESVIALLFMAALMLSLFVILLYWR